MGSNRQRLRESRTFPSGAILIRLLQVPIDVARHLCAIFESADVRFVIRVQMVLAIGTRDEAAREISRWAAIGILLPGCLTMPATRSPITTGEGPHEDYVRSSAVLNAKDRSLAHENNAVPGIDLLKDAGKLLKEQVAVDEPDHIRISNMITLLVESMTEMDTLVDQIAGMAESTREESVLDEIEFQIHDFVKLTIEAHNKISECKSKAGGNASSDDGYSCPVDGWND